MLYLRKLFVLFPAEFVYGIPEHRKYGQRIGIDFLYFQIGKKYNLMVTMLLQLLSSHIELRQLQRHHDIEL